jgi:hypothetical protein
MRMPGGRHLRTPTMSSTAAAIDATSMKLRPEQPDVRADARLVLRGERRIHEPAALRRRAEEDRAADEDAAEEKLQKPNAESRGNGRSRAPSICGSTMIENASKIGTANRNIITEPWSVKSWL